MEEKIYNALKNKFSNLGLGDKILRSQAAMLNGLGVVTDENLDTVIAGQEKTLKEFQSVADKSRNEKKSVEEKLAELQKKLAEKGGGDNPPPTNNEPLTFESIKAMFAKEREEWEANAATAIEAEQAKQARVAKIIQTAKELGIPEWRQNEGFVISDDADDETIKTYLTGIKQNITVAGLETKEVFPLAATKEVIKTETEKFVAGLPDA